ncbi:DUF6415 family natural product biosynthesis protein [Streptomyces sp. NPDC101175]|uniref:DUF6415 family natural product biosynthesis protein n=1 Tax=Streptomyces sp. NPDC101175 TaxID=3366123 RepID=UPI003832D3EF
MTTGRTQNATDDDPAGTEELPPDIDLMRGTARLLLVEDPEPLAADELSTVISALRGHIAVLVPDVGQLAVRLPKDDIPRACALACCGEARMRMRLDDGDTPDIRTAAAQRLARSVLALCDHYENLGGVVTG